MHCAPSRLRTLIQRGERMSQVPMVVVPGHGVWINDGSPDGKWVGIFPGEGELLAEHIRAGVELAVRTKAVLVFSGGMTREQAGRRSEAESYEDYAKHKGWFGGPKPQVLLEKFGLDSLSNLVFCLACYKDAFGIYPSKVYLL